jgi:hypothetical protein
MWRRVGARHGVRLRDAIVVLTLFSHLMVTLGFPLPASTATKAKDASRPFPCQNRPCGCLTADECWKGDCCCFTLEEKLAWADANGIEPPDHVRPLVASRKARPSPLGQKNHAGCCSETAQHEEAPSTATTSSCCRQDAPLDARCCPDDNGGSEESRSDCPACAAKASLESCKKRLSTDRPGVRWVVGMFARKCRGEGPAGLFQLEPAVFPELTSYWLTDRPVVSTLTDCPQWLTSTSHCPPTPPPRPA